MKLAMPWPRHLVTRLSSQRPGFSPRLVHVGFVMDSVALGHGFLPVHQFSLSLSFHHCSIFICHWHHLVLAINIVVKKHTHTHTHTCTQTKNMKHGLFSATEEAYDIFRDRGMFLLLFTEQQFSLYHLVKEGELS